MQPAHATRLKERIITVFKGDLEEQGTENGPKTLVFSDGLNTLVKDSLQARLFDEEMQTLMATAKLIREVIFVHDGIYSVVNYSSSRVDVVYMYVCVCPPLLWIFTMG